MASILALLSEDDPILQQGALKRLETVIDHEWTNVASYITTLEELCEKPDFPEKQLASLIASKVFFHLGEYDEALNFALGAGDKFEINKTNDPFVDKIIERCIDNYIKQRILIVDENEKSLQLDPRLENVVNRMFQRCFDDGKFKQALGIALESRRLDIAKNSITNSKNVSKMLAYCVQISNELITSREFRSKVLRMVADLFASESLPKERRNYFGQAECYLFLDDDDKVFHMLKSLIKSTDSNDSLVAIQIAFDLQDRAPQHFLTNIRHKFSPPKDDTMVTTLDEQGEATNVTQENDQNIPEDERSETYKSRVQKLLDILDGTVPIQYHLDFLNRRNQADIQILNNIKNSFDKNSICHNATVVANAYMHAGTTVDKFLRDNLDWLAQATNWAKFSATASMGVIHKGDWKRSRERLAPYLPKEDNPGSTSVYSEGGALYALGLIHANRSGDEMTEYLASWVAKESTIDPVLMHGASLGLGLTAMASEDQELYERLSSVCFSDNAVSSESAAIAMGLVMLGSGNKDAIEEMSSYAHETAHEKIIRGLSLGVALTMYGREEEADSTIETLLSDEDQIIRYGATYTLGMAYCGTNNNAAVQKLLKIGVSDVSDDVRRAAITNLGFVMFKSPSQVPRLVSLLAQSYNPHVRYGVAMALAVSCAGTGLKEAIDILEPLTKDDVDYVQQGAYIAMAMVLIQLNENSVDKNGEKVGDNTKKLRELIEGIYKGRHLPMKKMGAILSAGVMDAGGRNVTICLHKNGHNKMRNIVGLMMFTQYWFWYPYLHFLSLAFEPTSIIGLNYDLQMPEFKFKSNAPPSRFAYPEKTKPKEKEKKTVGPAAALSVTKKKQRDERRKHRDGGETGGSPLTPFTPNTPFSATPLPPSTSQKSKQNEDAMEIDTEKEEKKKEPDFQTLENPARVTMMQLEKITFDVDQDKYDPLKKQPELGFMVLKHLQEGEEKIVQMRESGVDEDEVAPPSAFEWDEEE